MKNNIKIGLISDGKYGERAYQNIKKRFMVDWIEVPEIPTNVMIDDEIDLKIPDCDFYISYVRHPDIIIQLAELQKPLILGVLPGYGLYEQIKRINPQTVHAPTMCSLENNTNISVIDEFTTYFGRPIYETQINNEGIISEIKVKRSSLCGSSEAGSQFLLNKEFKEENLQQFALSVCHECRAPRFGKTCDKEVAGIIHLLSLFNSIPSERISDFGENLIAFKEKIENEYEVRSKNSELL